LPLLFCFVSQFAIRKTIGLKIISHQYSLEDVNGPVMIMVTNDRGQLDQNTSNVAVKIRVCFCSADGYCACNAEYISGGTLKARVMDLSVELPWQLRIQLSKDVACGMVLHVYNSFTAAFCHHYFGCRISILISMSS